ncbi:MAG: hypothetical protein ACR2NJ_01490, partial [Acidimicrobiales bacterium]
MAPGGPERLVRGAWRALSDPRLTGVAQALPRTAAVLSRARATQGMDGFATAGISAGLAAQVLLDEVLISVMRNPKLFPHREDYERAAENIRFAHDMWRDRGWLDDPAAFHSSPAAPASANLARERTLDQRYEHLSFESGYLPHEREPGYDRWLSHDANRTAHAYVVRHREQGRPWLVCLHGFGMGAPAMDLRAFRA